MRKFSYLLLVFFIFAFPASLSATPCQECVDQGVSGAECVDCPVENNTPDADNIYLPEGFSFKELVEMFYKLSAPLIGIAFVIAVAFVIYNFFDRY